MIKSFLEHSNDNSGKIEELVVKLSSAFILYCEKIKTVGKYSKVDNIQIQDPCVVDVEFIVKKDPNPDLKSDPHFKKLSWESINFNRFGFAIDAKMIIDKEEKIVPKIVVICIVSPELKSYDDLYYRLYDIFTHEINHLDQIGWNRKPFNTRPSSGPDRESSKQSYLYFKLQDEVESMVEGMYARSKEEGVALDLVFDNYLYPFLEVGKISKSEYLETLHIWIKYALENFPDSEFSEDNKIVQTIINSI